MPYLGNSHIAGDQINNFKVLDDISSHTSTFDGSASGVVSISDNTIRIPEHRFVQGQRVTYNNGGGGNIGNLSSGTAYYIIKDTNNTIKLATSLSNANNSTAINLSVLGSGSSHTLNVAFDGVNTKFKITHNGGTPGRINNATQLSLAINNVIQRPNQNAVTFTEGFAIEDQHKIVFKVAPTSSDIFWGSILANTLPTFDITDNKIDNFTGDGSTTEFNLSNIPASNKSIMVTINGVLQHPSDGSTSRSYTLLANILQFTAAPGNGDEIQVRHIGFAGASTSDVTGFYGRTGNVVLTSNDHITTGNINAGVVTATTFVGNLTGNVSGNLTVGGVLTYEDVTNVDSIGIITARSGFKVLAGGANVVGVITARTNIHLEDYIHHLGDLTTKIGFPAANTVTLEAGGAARVRIINTQTKIGPDADSATASTNYEFQISGYSTGNCYALSLKHGTSGVGKNLRQAFFFKNSGNTSVDLARFQATCTDNTAGSESGDLAFYTTNAGTSGERLRIDSSGNLSIPGNSSAKDITYGDGSTTGYFRSITNVNRANSEQSIHMQQFKWNNTKVAEFKVLTGIDTTNKDNAHIVFETANSGTTIERLRIASDGNIGIGITNPGSPLQIVDSSDASIRIYDSTGATGDLSSSGWKFRAIAGNAATNANGLQISHGTTEKIHITSEGNVIIAETMAVNRPRIVLSAPNDSTNYRHLFGANLQVNSSGTFTTPTANISGGGWEYLPANSLNSHGHIRYLSAPDTNATSSTPLERLRIDATGRVLIGVDAATNSDSYVQAFKPTGNDATITVGNVATSASGLCRYDFAPSNKVVGARIECHATEDFSIGENRTADLVFITRLNGTLSEKVRILSDGKVGINVTDPDSDLEINRGSEGKYLTIGGDDANNGRALSFTSSTDNTGSNGALHTINAKSGNGAIALATAGTERLRITSTEIDAQVPITGAVPAPNRNIIENGEFLVSQRFGDASSTKANSGTNIQNGVENGVIDRWRMASPSASNIARQRVTDAPDGFAYSFKISNDSSVFQPSNANYSFFQQIIEATNVARLAFGTSSAKTVTLSFYVKSSYASSTWAVALGSLTGGVYPGNATRTHIKSYSISSANTWERKTITFPGDTSGTWPKSGTGGGLAVIWDLGSGGNHQGAATSTWVSSDDYRFSGAKNVGDSANGSWQITGIQLEIGSTATEYEHVPIQYELQRCQRYFYCGNTLGSGSWNSPTTFHCAVHHPVAMRARVTSGDTRSGGLGNINIEPRDAYDINSFDPDAHTHYSPDHAHTIQVMNFQITGSTTTGYSGTVSIDRNNDQFWLSAEL